MPKACFFSSMGAARTLCRRRSAAESTLATALFTAALVAFSAVVASADESNDSNADESVQDQFKAAERIVVTASPLQRDRDELSMPVDRIDREELLENLGSTLGETINQIPGIASTGFTGGASRPVIRGQDAYRTEVLEDGLRIHDVSQESPDHGLPVNPLVAERVEVVRGPSTLRYGGGASAGVVNVITKRVPDELQEEGFSGEVFGGIGLLANQRDLAASLNGRKGTVAFHADGVFRHSNDYSIPNDDRPHVQAGTHVDAWMGSVGAAWIGDKARVGASYTRIENDYGLPEAGESVEINMHADRFRFEGDLIQPFEGIRELRVRGVYTDYEHDEGAEGEIGQTYRNEEFDGRIEVFHAPILGFTGAIGLQGQQRDFRTESEAAEFLSPTDRAMAALYFFEERAIVDEVNLEGGFRGEHTRIEGVDASDTKRDLDFTALSGALGFVYTPLDWLTIGANGSISQRAPSQVELFARGGHEATGTFELGDKDLDLETAFTGDFRIEAQNDRGRIEAAGFVTHYEDYIFAALDGVLVDEDGTVDPAGDLERLFYTDRDALFYGFEISGELDVYEIEGYGTLAFDGRFDYVRARFDGNGVAGGSNNVPRITPMRWGAGVSFRNDHIRARVGFVRTEEQSETSSFESRTNDFTYVNASLVHTIELGDDLPVDLSIIGRNLADVRGRNHVAFNKDEVLLPGRSIRFAIRARF